MASAVDTTFPPDNEQVDKAEMRAQFLVISNEITALQHKTSLAWQIATGVQAMSS